MMVEEWLDEDELDGDELSDVMPDGGTILHWSTLGFPFLPFSAPQLPPKKIPYLSYTDPRTLWISTQK